MKESRRFLVAVGVGAVALLVVWFVLVAPVRRGAAEASANIETKSRERERFFAERGEPVDAAKKGLEEEKARLDRLKSALGRLVLEVPARLLPAEDRDTLYFQQQLARLRERAKGSGVGLDDKAAPLGFSQQPQDEQVGEYLARLEAASRFLEAAKAAGIQAVKRADQSAAQPGASGGGRRALELPMKVVVAADEKSLILLLHELSRPESFLALKGLSVEVKDASSGHFDAEIELAGVWKVEKAEGPAGASAGGADDGAGTDVPTRRRRRYR